MAFKKPSLRTLFHGILEDTTLRSILLISKIIFKKYIFLIYSISNLRFEIIAVSIFRVSFHSHTKVNTQTSILPHIQPKYKYHELVVALINIYVKGIQ